jgi:GT2 family glycosyltransferase/ubiquinone/menaquinone biosynthesis C-methylase UbiE/glycosyltransferase involved in cell wall biosynthesis
MEMITEHQQRYLSILPLVEGKRVLDIASGEGYGSNWIAERAKSVVGVDISEEAIANARGKYQRDNLQFLTGSVAEIPLEDHSVDVIVSFETIEHVDEELQRQFLTEAKRVLTENGILVISTPNKLEYSDKRNYSNEFHIKEFYYDEFMDFIGREFSYTKVYNQAFRVVSLLCGKEEQSTELSLMGNTQDNTDGKYYIVIASNVNIQTPDISSVYIGDRNEYAYLHQRILTLQSEEEERNAHIAKLDGEIEEKNAYIAKLTNEQENSNAYLAQLQGQMEDLKQIICNKEGHIELLLRVERDYENDKRTMGYRILAGARKVWYFILPKNSKRRFFLMVLKKIIRHPILMAHVINPKRIRTYLQVSRQNGMEEVFAQYRGAVDLEKTGLNMPVAGHETNLMKVNPAETAEVKNIEDYDKLVFTEWKELTVSIVIPVYNEFSYTYNCLKSIMLNSGNVKYEIIIADDCSTDCTREIKKVAENVKLITTEKNVRFLLNCNNAAKYARGAYILFLNNDTQVQPDWLQTLVDVMETREDAGMVGSKLIYPDGRLQEAGGIVWKDASAWNYGHLQDPDDPSFTYLKEADYVSGAAIMIRTSLWNEIGGFDETFVPAYYEDTDLAFEVRRHGYKVYMQPKSVVVHFEGVSNGTDTSTGLKAYQVANNKKFYEKWKTVLEKEHFENGQDVYLAKDRGQLRKQILVVDHYVPNYDKDAGGRCTYMYIKMFLKMGLKVTFIGDNFARPEPYTSELNNMGVEILFGNWYYNNWQTWLKDNLHYFDYVYLQRPHISIKYIDIVKKYARGKIFYFAHDLHHVRMYRDYMLTGDKKALEDSEHWKKIEMELFEKTDVGHVVGNYEQEIMQKAFPNKPIRNIPLYIYDEFPDGIEKDFSKRKDIIFVGGFGHTPNIDAVMWFAENVYTRILEKYPEMVWHIVGSKAPEEVLKLAGPNVIIEGFVSDEDLAKLYKSCRLAVVPLRYGAGVKGKVVEASYYQIPLVTTSIGGEGLDASMESFLMEDDADKMAELICDLYEDYDRLRKMSDAGKSFISTYFTSKVAEEVLLADM